MSLIVNVPTSFYDAPEIISSSVPWFHRNMRSIALFFRKYTGRQFGIPHFVEIVSKLFPASDEIVLIGPDGKEFSVRASQGGFSIVTGGFAISEAKLLNECIPPDAVILDVGANTGVWTRLFCSRVRQGKIYAFEPSPITYEILKKNAFEHSMIQCCNIAASDFNGVANFSVEGTSGLHHLSPSAGKNTKKVQVKRLDDWVNENKLQRIDLVKIDIEGHEMAALFGFKNSLDTFRPIVVFEFIPQFLDRHINDKQDSIFILFEKMGYEIFRLDKSGLAYRNMDEKGPQDWTNDYIAIDFEKPNAISLSPILKN